MIFSISYRLVCCLLRCLMVVTRREASKDAERDCCVARS
jgi:hypothetical protein